MLFYHLIWFFRKNLEKSLLRSAVWNFKNLYKNKQAQVFSHRKNRKTAYKAKAWFLLFSAGVFLFSPAQGAGGASLIQKRMPKAQGQSALAPLLATPHKEAVKAFSKNPQGEGFSYASQSRGKKPSGFLLAKSPSSNLGGTQTREATESSGSLQPKKPQSKEQAATVATSNRKPANIKSLIQPIAAKRKLSQEDEPFLCRNHFRSKYKTGGVFLSIPCKPDVSYCLSFSEMLRNRCNDDGRLVRYQCDQASPNGISAEIIECENGCEFGLCKPDEDFEGGFF